jgi:mandelate racemase
VANVAATPSPSGLTIGSAITRGFRVPLTFTLGTSAAIVRSVPLLLVDIRTREGVTGRSYLFCYTLSGARAVAGHIEEALELVAGLDAAPGVVATLLARRFALLGVTGPVRMALSALDIALWDALATSWNQPLATVLGSSPRPVPAYDSRGLGLMEPARLASEAEELVASRGLGAIKLRLGYASLAEDLRALAAVRERTAADLRIMVDYNQALTVTEAIRRGRALQAEGIDWLEEPIRHDDFRGAAAVAGELDVPVQIGENFNGPDAMLEALTFGACDFVMPDVARIGGVTGWMHAAGIAAAHGVRMSSHLVPEISAPLLSATPTAHWLEYVDWADAIVQEPIEVVDGSVLCPDRPGLGLAWDESKLSHLEAL